MLSLFFGLNFQLVYVINLAFEEMIPNGILLVHKILECKKEVIFG